jgi:hypothetical protein
VLSIIFICPVLCFGWLIPRQDLLNVVVGITISFNDLNNIYEYNYDVTNLQSSEQDLQMIFIEYDGENPEAPNPPNNWRISLGRSTGILGGKPYVLEDRTPNNMLNLAWIPKHGYKLRPGDIQKDLIIKAKGLPTIVSFYAMGQYIPPPLPQAVKPGSPVGRLKERSRQKSPVGCR